MRSERHLGKTGRAVLGSILAALALGACTFQDGALPPTRALIDFSTCNKPNYPLESAQRNSIGTVKLAFYVLPNGTLAESKIAESSGDPLLDNAARDALKLCRARPATENGKPVAQWMNVEYVWSIEE